MSLDITLDLPFADFRLQVDLHLPGRGITALFGPSGSGKTSLLRCVAGLERAPHGQISVNGECWQDSTRRHFLAPHKRALGYVFQEASLFPHLSVRGNLDYGQKRIAPAARRIALDQAVQLLGIGHLLERPPATLSGGERQRVGIARPCSPARNCCCSTSRWQPSTASASRRSCPTWNACTTSWTSPCSTSAMRPMKWRAWPIT